MPGDSDASGDPLIPPVAPEIEPGLLRSRLSGPLRAAFGISILRRNVIRLVHRLEGGRFRSATLREILAEHHGVQVGAYSYGCCLQPGALPPGVSVGRYVSTAETVGIYRRSRPLDRLSLHPYFLNPDLGVVSSNDVVTTPLRIEHDAWLGDRSIVLPGCTRIGVGAVVGAGAVVTEDVPDFAVVVGNPARVVKFRFESEVQAAILESRWWDHTIEELSGGLDQFAIPVEALPEFARSGSERPRSGEPDGSHTEHRGT